MVVISERYLRSSPAAGLPIRNAFRYDSPWPKNQHQISSTQGSARLIQDHSQLKNNKSRTLESIPQLTFLIWVLWVRQKQEKEATTYCSSTVNNPPQQVLLRGDKPIQKPQTTQTQFHKHKQQRNNNTVSDRNLPNALSHHTSNQQSSLKTNPQLANNKPLPPSNM